MISLKKSIAAVITVGVLSLNALAGNDVDSSKQDTLARVPQNTCPIMGGDIDKGTFADHEGKRVYFCCSMCEGTFKKDPVKYIEMIESMGQDVEIIAADIKEKKENPPAKKTPKKAMNNNKM